VLTPNLNSEKIVSVTTGLMHRGLESAALRFPDHVAVLAGDDRWTFGELDRAANAVARHFVSLGVGPGDRVAVMTSNRPEFVVVVQAASRLGAAPVLLNSSWKAREVETALGLTGPRCAVADGAAVALLVDQLGAAAVLDLDAPGAASVIDRAGTDGPPDAVVGETDDAVFVFSSGTTDSPKAVRHTHGSIALATEHWCLALGLTNDDRFQVATPPSHILGLLNLLAAAAAGATVRLHRRFDLDEELRCIEDERMTLEMAVAPIALALANHPDLERYDLSSLRYVMWGATPVTPSVAETVTARSGVRWLPAYGTSEVPVITANPVDRPDAWRLDSAGLPVGDVELRVADLDSGAVLPPGETGEIQVRSATAMAGYLPEAATAAAFADGQWYRTGDVGYLEPEGWVHLTDRRKEMIKVRGFQVAPAEIEAVLHGHPAVVDCAVFGVPDEQAGEVPVAAVKLEANTTVSADDLQRLVDGELATYKHLYRVVLVDSIPRTPSGKVLRRVLRDEWAPQLSPAVSGAG
jgi:long-chain acyl-CoA synthetase